MVGIVDDGVQASDGPVCGDGGDEQADRFVIAGAGDERPDVGAIEHGCGGHGVAAIVQRDPSVFSSGVTFDPHRQSP